MTITLGVNMITRQIMPCFNLLFELYVLVCFILAFQDLQNSISCGPPLCIMFWSVQYTFICKDDTFKPVFFFSLKFANCWYITCFVPNLIPIWPRSHGLLRQNQSLTHPLRTSCRCEKQDLSLK